MRERPKEWEIKKRREMKRKRKGKIEIKMCVSKDVDSRIIGYKYGTFFETIWGMDKPTEDRLQLESIVSNFLNS